jgi:hypothetical protein
MGKKGDACRILVGKSEGKKPLRRELSVGWRIILKLISEI